MSDLLDLAWHACQLVWELPTWILRQSPPRFLVVLVWLWRLVFLGLFGLVLYVGAGAILGS